MKKYIIKYRMLSLTALGNDFQRVPLEAWRIHVKLNPRDNDVRFNNLLMSEDMSVNPITVNEWVVEFTLGGVILPDGTPVMVKDVLEVLAGAAFVGNTPRGVIIFEDLVPC